MCPPRRRRGVDERGAEIVQGYRTRQCSGEVRDGGVTTRGQVLFIEGDVLSDDGFAKTGKPYEEARFPVLVAGANVDAGFTARSEFPLFLECLVL